MAYANVSYTATGTQSQFALTFPYIDKTHIEVYVDGVLTSSYTWASASVIQLNSTPIAGVVVMIKRNTPKTARLVDFQDASVLTERDLDLDANQGFYIGQEAADLGADSLILNAARKWDAKGIRLINLPDAVSPSEPVTKGRMDYDYPAVSTVANYASQVNIVATDLGAPTSVSTDMGLITDPATTTPGSGTSKIVTVADHITDVTTVAGNITAIQNASGYASSASASATSASASASSASTSATAASSSAASASSSATSALASKNAAATSETNAAASATSASSSATSASSSASSASTSATNASSSATAAASSASSAATSATNAATSETNAASSAAAAAAAVTNYYDKTTADARYAYKSHTHALSDLTVSGATTGQVATWNGTTWAPATPTTGVSSFNTRTGAVTLSAADVTTALGYTPLSSAPVTSVAGRTGAITLSNTDISGLGTLATKSSVAVADLAATLDLGTVP